VVEGEDLLVLRLPEDVLHAAFELVVSPFQLHHIHPVDYLVPLHALRSRLAQEFVHPEKDEECEGKGKADEHDHYRCNSEWIFGNLYLSLCKSVHVVVVDGCGDDEQYGNKCEQHEFCLEKREGLLRGVIAPEIGDDGDVRN